MAMTLQMELFGMVMLGEGTYSEKRLEVTITCSGPGRIRCRIGRLI